MTGGKLLQTTSAGDGAFVTFQFFDIIKSCFTFATLKCLLRNVFLRATDMFAKTLARMELSLAFLASSRLESGGAL